ncbi:Dabb family protein [Candidatus Mycobacterium wuenschmannii]|uniref:Dabb family protein n=1 Tax=Candidatus Mycobacterium wuenschmannii TaxID=3027808 RepID=A0ABY8VU88_9MYCO|nr:Dabb family protein [Candidatus Mycobacterium wuenschmannii]WIM86232.1 Dabb family protein [Candidatus Mycobacterium wuenschmannii]
MYSVTRLLDVGAGARDRVLATARSAAADTGARLRLVEPTLPGSRNGGDILVHLRFGTVDGWHSSAASFDAVLRDRDVTRINGASYPGTATNRDGGTIYRTLLLRVQPNVHADVVARFEDDLLSMTRYVPAITAWQLSRVDHAMGDAQWTHVFEQEFSDARGLNRAYLMHPIHWAVVDRWFDPECPEVIVRDRLCHSFCAAVPSTGLF